MMHPTWTRSPTPPSPALSEPSLLRRPEQLTVLDLLLRRPAVSAGGGWPSSGTGDIADTGGSGDMAGAGVWAACWSPPHCRQDTHSPPRSTSTKNVFSWVS